MAKATNLAWAAGLFEGEGSCHIGRTAHRQPCVSLGMTDQDVVARFVDIVGVGHVRSYPSRSENRKGVFRWSVQGADEVSAVLSAILPWLGVRRRARALEVLARAEEIIAARGLCKRGHDLAIETNVYMHVKSGKRHCRPCRMQRDRSRERVTLG